jgi:hypothetical protein
MIANVGIDTTGGCVILEINLAILFLDVDSC